MSIWMILRKGIVKACRLPMLKKSVCHVTLWKMKLFDEGVVSLFCYRYFLGFDTCVAATTLQS